MRDLLVLLVHFLTTLARLLGPGGTRAVIAETLLIKHQLVILNRSRRRAPNLTAADRIVMGLCTLFMNPSRIRKVAAALKPATLLAFHRELLCNPRTPVAGVPSLHINDGLDEFLRWAFGSWLAAALR